MMPKASSDSKEHESMDMLYPANSDKKDNFLIGLMISMKNYPKDFVVRSYIIITIKSEIIIMQICSLFT